MLDSTPLSRREEIEYSWRQCRARAPQLPAASSLAPPKFLRSPTSPLSVRVVVAAAIFSGARVAAAAAPAVAGAVRGCAGALLPAIFLARCDGCKAVFERLQ